MPDANSTHGGSWNPCGNGAVGVYGYPVDLMKDVMGFNEKHYFWGGVEAEFCDQARNSSKYFTWIDLYPEVCDPSFSHMQHGYGERRHNGAQGDTRFSNNAAFWGLLNETIAEYVF